MLHKFGPGFEVAFEGAYQGAGDHGGVGFFDVPHHAAHVHPLDHYGHPVRMQDLVNKIRNLSGCVGDLRGPGPRRCWLKFCGQPFQ